jgi:hypothetical protein
MAASSPRLKAMRESYRGGGLELLEELLLEEALWLEGGVSP